MNPRYYQLEFVGASHNPVFDEYLRWVAIEGQALLALEASGHETEDNQP